MAQPLLEVIDLKKFFPIRGGFFRTIVGNVRAVDGVSFAIDSGKTLGLVGESGCGKSTLGRAILRLQEPTAGEIRFNGESLSALSGQALTHKRRDLQIIFQDPFASLNPRMTIREIIREPMDTHRVGSEQEIMAKMKSLLDIVGLRPQVLNRYPHEFSGGQRQRIGIARALTLNPKFIVADEPVSALDVSVQSQVLNLISNLQREFGISFLFISHDLAVVQHISHDVGVMYLGKMVEMTASNQLYATPKHPYTISLISAVPVPDPFREKKKIFLQGDVPSPMAPPPGCYFHPRCLEVMDKCSQVAPEMVDVGTEGQPHLVACHLFK